MLELNSSPCNHVTLLTFLTFPMELIHETDILCPHCGESFPLQIDTSQSEQTLIEDCSVCCRPIALKIYCRPGEIQSVSEAGA